MEREAFDRLARAFGRAGSRRAALGLAIGGIAAALRGERVEAAAFDRDCTRFIISAGTDPDDKFRHVDDDLTIELVRKGKRKPKSLVTDTNGTPNGEDGRHIKPVKFRARVGDRIRIAVRNSVGTGEDDACEFDGAWLYCDERGSRGKQVIRKFKRTEVDGKRCKSGADFIDETFRIKP